MFIALGALTGVLGFIPLSIAMRTAHRSTSTQALTVGFYGLAGVAVSMLILIVGLVICGILARDGIIMFVGAEAAVFLVLTIAYVFYRNVFASRNRKE